ncbi:MAG: 50S ribosomal protein L11 methyltransferase [Aestuariivirgaceae bacterium]
MRALPEIDGQDLPFRTGHVGRRGNSLTPATVRDFPAWHFAMLNDHDRNTAIEHMISRLDLRGKVVFEIGTGCGLVALLFAKYGAKHVYSCEVNLRLAEIAAAVIAGTNLGNCITLFKTCSTTVLDRGLLPLRPDIVFTETLDCGVIGEGFYTVARDIRRIADNETIMIPGLVQQFGILVEAPALAKLNRVGMACGFDLSPLNAYSTRNYFPVRERLYDYTLLSEPFLMREYSYLEERASAPCPATAYRSGVADGVLSWFEARFGDETVTNSPGTHGHWHQAYHPFAGAIEVTAKEGVLLSIDAEGHVVPGVALPR